MRKCCSCVFNERTRMKINLPKSFLGNYARASARSSFAIFHLVIIKTSIDIFGSEKF